MIPPRIGCALAAAPANRSVVAAGRDRGQVAEKLGADSEGELGLQGVGPHAQHPESPLAGGVRGGREKGRLADPGAALQEKRTTVALQRRIERLPQLAELALAFEQLDFVDGRGHETDYPVPESKTLRRVHVANAHPSDLEPRTR